MGVAAIGIVNWFNIFQISVKYNVYKQFVTASDLLKNTLSVEEWMVATTFREIKEHWKKAIT